MNNFSNTSQGIVYAASGKKYQHECTRSIKSLRAVNESIPIVVFTDSPVEFACLQDHNLQIVNLNLPTYGFQDKIQAISRSPFQKTLFLDSDTIILQDPVGIFEILNRFDIAVTAESYKPGQTESIPACFPEFNTGVIAYKSSNQSIINLLKDWTHIFCRDLKSLNRPKHDQPSFREALYLSSVRLCTISNEWNFHIAHPIVLNAGAQITILHTRILNKDIKRQGKTVYKGSRIFLPTTASIHPDRLGSMNRRLDFWLSFLTIPFRIWAHIFRQK